MNVQSKCYIIGLSAKLQVDWCKHIKVLINSYKNYYNGLGINKSA